MKFLTKDELAAVLRVSVRTVTTYVSRGVLPQPLRLGRKLLWNEDVISQLLSPKAVAAVKAKKAGRPRIVDGL